MLLFVVTCAALSLLRDLIGESAVYSYVPQDKMKEQSGRKPQGVAPRMILSLAPHRRHVQNQVRMCKILAARLFLFLADATLYFILSLFVSVALNLGNKYKILPQYYVSLFLYILLFCSVCCLSVFFDRVFLGCRQRSDIRKFLTE